MRDFSKRAPQVCVLGSADEGSDAYELAASVGERIAQLGITLVSVFGFAYVATSATRSGVNLCD